MEKKKKITATKIAQKFIKHQTLIKKYLNNEITKQELDAQGVKLAMPL